MQILIATILLIVIILLLLVIFAAFFFLFDAFFELPYVPAKSNKVPTIIKLANIKKGETVVDLGSGDGRLLFAAAQKGACAIGYELNPYLVWFTKIKSHFFHPRDGQIIVYKQDLWKADLSVADVVFVYGRQKTMKKFQDFVYKNAKEGTRIIVNTDKTKPFPSKKPINVENDLFLYKVYKPS